MLLPYLDYRPALASPYDLAPSAAVAGRVTAGPGLVLRACATLRADGEAIRIGADVFFAERATAHIVDGRLPAVVGDRVTVGRYALVHACVLGDGVVVGDAAVVMDGAEVGAQALIAPGALVAPRKRLPGGAVYAGNPAVRVRDVAPEELAAAARDIRAGTPSSLVREDDLPPREMICRRWFARTACRHRWFTRTICRRRATPSMARRGRALRRSDAPRMPSWQPRQRCAARSRSPPTPASISHAR